VLIPLDADEALLALRRFHHSLEMVGGSGARSEPAAADD
jgi:hypothetical protein